MTILDAVHDPALFGSWFKHRSWTGWLAFVGACFGLPLDGDADRIFQEHTGRVYTPGEHLTEAFVVIGRRGGKSRIAALIVVYLACFRDYRQLLAPGEVGTLPIIAADRRQARTIMRYVNGCFDAVPMLGRMVTNKTKETIELSNRVVIEVHTASFRAIRGYTMIGAICDEIAFWQTDDGSANPDIEILNGLRPGMATVPGALLLCISSPYARRGALWDAYERHYGQDGDPILVWQADTRSMNPTVDERVITEAYEQDEVAAAAEYGAEFRRDIEGFVSREAVNAVVIPGRTELPPSPELRYHAFVDPSGGSQDSMTLAIAHRNSDKRLVLDCVRERRPPFSPQDVVEDFSATVKGYRLGTVSGDRYAGEWVREPFRRHGVSYQLADRTKSDFYRDLLPMLNSGQVELLDHKRLISQLCSLERRVARSGKDSIDHGPGGHDDVANAAAGVLVTAAVRGVMQQKVRWVYG